MYDPRRLTGTFLALAALAVALAIGSAAVSPVVAGHPRFLPDADSLCDVRDFNWNVARIAAVLRDGRFTGASPAGLGLLVGSSSLQWGIDAARLSSREAPGTTRWLSLSNLGATIADEALLVELALRAGLRPERVVLFLEPSSIAVRVGLLDDPDRPDFQAIRLHIARRNLMLLKEDIEGALLSGVNRAFPNRSRIGRWARMHLFASRLELFQALGYNLDALGPPMSDPWSATPGWARGLHLPEDMLDQQFAGLRSQRVFDPASYSTETQNSRDLVALIHAIRARGSDVVIVLVPEHERRRVAVPPEFVATLDATLRGAFGAQAPPVLNLRAAMPTEAFFDLSHLHPPAREAFTDLVGPMLRELRDRPGAGPAR